MFPERPGVGEVWAWASNSRFGQQKREAFAVERADGLADTLVEAPAAAAFHAKFA